MYLVFVQLLHSGRGSPLLAQLPRLLDSLRMRLAQLDNVRSRLVQLQARKQHMHGLRAYMCRCRLGTGTCAAADPFVPSVLNMNVARGSATLAEAVCMLAALMENDAVAPK